VASRPGGISRGDRNIAWIEAHCRIPEGRDVAKPVVLRAWQREIIQGIYDTPTRMAIVSFGRKNGKTALAAFLLLLHLCGPEARRNSQLLSAAQSKDQAAVLFALAAKIVRMSVDLAGFITVRDHLKQLFCMELGTLYRALSADAATAYGLSPAFTVHDELGQVRGPRSELFEALETAAGAQEEPLSIVISTQAPTSADLLSVLIDDAATKKTPTVKLFMFSAPEKADPFSEESIKAGNPAFGDFLNADEVRAQADSARRMPSQEAGYRNLILNQRVNQRSPLIARQVWEACGGVPDDAELVSQRVYIGIDLSARNDMTALAIIARDDAMVWHVNMRYFAPEAGLLDRAKRDRAPYDQWVREGFLTTTPGASVDYEYVASVLAELAASHDIALVAYDRWRMDVLKTELARISLEVPLKEFGQGFRDMSPAIDSLESNLLNGRIRHGMHPILTWNAANAISLKDPAGNRKMDKSRETGRIDGLVALTMAIGAADAAEVPAPPKSYQLLFVGSKAA
jgi:phage terminase large subunit-like protein